MDKKNQIEIPDQTKPFDITSPVANSNSKPDTPPNKTDLCHCDEASNPEIKKKCSVEKIQDFINRHYKKELRLFSCGISTIAALEGIESSLMDSFLSAIDGCIKNDIDYNLLLHIGYLFGRLPRSFLRKTSNKNFAVGSSDDKTKEIIESLPDYSVLMEPGDLEAIHLRCCTDENLEFRLIAQNHLLVNMDIKGSLRGYFWRKAGRHPDTREYDRLQQRYYRCINKSYVKETAQYFKKACENFNEQSISSQINPFETFANGNIHYNTHHVFYLCNNEGWAQLVYKKSSKEFWLLKNSWITRNMKASATKTWKNISDNVQQWLKNKTLLPISNSMYILQSDINVSSPSFAATLVVGCNVSGTKVWENQYKESLKEVLKSEKIADEKSKKNQRLRKKRKASMQKQEALPK